VEFSERSMSASDGYGGLEQSMPYNIQEIRHALDVETTYQMVNRVREVNPSHEIIYLCK